MLTSQFDSYIFRIKHTGWWLKCNTAINLQCNINLWQFFPCPHLNVENFKRAFIKYIFDIFHFKRAVFLLHCCIKVSHSNLNQATKYLLKPIIQMKECHQRQTFFWWLSHTPIKHTYQVPRMIILSIWYTFSFLS